MAFFSPQRLRLIVVNCLVLSLMGAFTFAAADLSSYDFWKSSSITGAAITNVDSDYTIECLAEYAVKIRGGASLPSRKSPYSTTLFGILYAGMLVSFSVIRIAKSIRAPNSKDIILLKLRI
jgi:hypothetical protein